MLRTCCPSDSLFSNIFSHLITLPPASLKHSLTHHPFRDSLRDAHLASVRAKEKHELAQQAAAAKGKADKVASLEKAIQEAKLNVDR